MKLLTQNSKLKKTSKLNNQRVFNFGIPAFKSKAGFSTCPNAQKCINGCYAKQGAYRFSNVVDVYEARLTATKQPEFQMHMVKALRDNKVDVLRIHDSGDFYSQKYLDKWLSIIGLCPDVTFYTYTKQVGLFKEYVYRGLIPKNFVVVYSFGGSEDQLINTETEPHAVVFPSVEALKLAGYEDCSSDDLKALTAQKIGLIFHGTKAYKNTIWSKVPMLRHLMHQNRS